MVARVTDRSAGPPLQTDITPYLAVVDEPSSFTRNIGVGFGIGIGLGVFALAIAVLADMTQHLSRRAAR